MRHRLAEALTVPAHGIKTERLIPFGLLSLNPRGWTVNYCLEPLGGSEYGLGIMGADASPAAEQVPRLGQADVTVASSRTSNNDHEYLRLTERIVADIHPDSLIGRKRTSDPPEIGSRRSMSLQMREKSNWPFARSELASVLQYVRASLQDSQKQKRLKRSNCRPLSGFTLRRRLMSVLADCK